MDTPTQGATSRASFAERRDKTSRARLVVIIGALSAFGPLSMDMYLPSLPRLSLELGATPSEGQLTLTACLLGLALGQIICGPMSDTFGRRRPLLAGIAIYALASFACAFAPNVFVLIALRFLQGLAGSAGIVIGRAVVRDIYTGNDIARFFTLSNLVSGLAPILAPIIGGQLLLFTDWHGVFIFLSMIGFGLFLLAGLGLPESLPVERRRSGGVRNTLATFRKLSTDRTLVGYGMSGGLALGAAFAYVAGSPFVLQNIYGVSPQVFSLIFGTNAIGIIVASQVSGRLIGKVPLRRLLSIGLTTSFVGGALLLTSIIFGFGLVTVLPAFFLIVGSLGLIGPNAAALALADHPHTAGAASALLGVLQYVFGGIIAPFVGIAGTNNALPMAILVAICTVSASLSFILLTRPTQQAAPVG